MSTRVYPTFIKGNPRLRIFLPNFFMKLVKPKRSEPANHVRFIIPLEMTDDDVKSYLNNIYNVPVCQVRTSLYEGEIKRNHKNYLIKEPDFRMAHVILPEDMKFEFPDLFPEAKKDKADEDQNRLLDQATDLMKQRRRNWDRKDIPTWFGL
ncbi:putative 39S ribosomal protein L23, mitochondrial [Araneus ventricosus]|uniref:Large ribosomal subunit protein uL23m n=1 Tax=Araneus ventricosus TaxID=182803 RepID=A0A4Y2G0A9_ARAVE|nr:putative 39S ribosomal protein L23, mitochondrial [Araneus ventricosus]